MTSSLEPLKELKSRHTTQYQDLSCKYIVMPNKTYNASSDNAGYKFMI